MHDDQAITAALQQASPSPFTGYYYRVIDDEHRGDPLSGIGSIIHGGRYNPPHSFEVSYSSDSRVTALTEVEALFGDVDQPRSPELILTLAVQLMRALNLTDPVFQEALGPASPRRSFDAATRPPHLLCTTLLVHTHTECRSPRRQKPGDSSGALHFRRKCPDLR